MRTSSFAELRQQVASVLSTTAAGTMSQMARGVLSLLTKSSSEVEPTEPSLASASHVRLVHVEHDALVAAFLQTANHVCAHSPRPIIPSCIGKLLASEIFSNGSRSRFSADSAVESTA